MTRSRIFVASAIALLAGHAHAQQASVPLCTDEQAFGVRFGDQASRHSIGASRGARGANRFAYYDVGAQIKDPRFAHFSIEADRETGEIYSVTAYTPSFEPGPESEYDQRILPALRPLTKEFADNLAVQVNTDNRPPYSGQTGDVELTVWHTLEGGRIAFTFTCTNKQWELKVQKRAWQD